MSSEFSPAARLQRLRSCARAWMLAALVCLAASWSAFAQHLTVQIYGVESGLTSPSTTALAQDRAGFLYLGTQSGLFRYDGFRFEQLGTAEGLPAAGEVDVIRPAPDGRIWVVYPDRIFLTGVGPTLSAPLAIPLDERNVHRADTLGQDLLLIHDGQLLVVHPTEGGQLSVQSAVIGTDRAAMKAPGARAPPRLETVYVDHGTILVGCGLSVCRVQAGRLVDYATAYGLPPDHWAALLRDHDGTLWLRSPRRIAWLARGAATFKVIDVPDGPGRFLDDADQLSLVEDAGGQVVTQGASGLLVHQNGRWIAFNRTSPTGPIQAQAMLEDRHGSLWIGNVGPSVARVTGLGVFENWNHADGLSDNLVWNVARGGKDTLWVATNTTIDQLTRQDTLAKPLDPRSSRRTYALAASPGGWLWLGQETGPHGADLIRRNPRNGRAEVVGRLPLVRILKFGPTGQLWIATQHGLATIDHPADATPSIRFELGSYRGPVFAIRFDAAGNPWILTSDTIYRRDASGAWQVVAHTDPAGGYPTRQMVFGPDDTLWLGSLTTGITRLHLRDNVVTGHDQRPSSHLSSMVVQTLSRDRTGKIWVGTDHGLDVTDGARWRHLDDQDGLASNDLTENAVFSDHDDSAWFGTAGGLSHLLDPDAVFAAPPQELDPVISRLSFAGHALPLPTWRDGTLDLHWTSAPLVIGFSSLAFARSGSIRFRYRLRGVDQDWVDTISHEARYPSVPPGKLVFEVMALDTQNQLVSKPARLTFRLRAPWWLTWPAYFGLASLVALALMAIWRLRIRILLARQRQLESLVEERTREIEQARLILLKRATFDPLTGLLSRGAALERLEHAMTNASRSRTPLGVALLDLDHFKAINDQFGHLSGDAVLRQCGERLTAALRGTDFAGRYGGEELLVVLPELRPEALERMQTLLADVFTEPFGIDQTTLRVTGSMGVTWMIPDDDLTALIRRADVALYSAKLAGRDRVVFDCPATQKQDPILHPLKAEP